MALKHAPNLGSCTCKLQTQLPQVALLHHRPRHLTILALTSHHSYGANFIRGSYAHLEEGKRRATLKDWRLCGVSCIACDWLTHSLVLASKPTLRGSWASGGEMILKLASIWSCWSISKSLNHKIYRASSPCGFVHSLLFFLSKTCIGCASLRKRYKKT